MTEHDAHHASRITFHVSRFAFYALLALCLLAFALGVYRLGVQSLWFDEGESVWVPAQGFSSIAPIMAIRGLLPLYFYIIWTVAPLIGQTEFALRFVSLFFGVLLPPLTFVLARRLYNMRAGVWAALFVAVSPFVVYYDQEARMYTLLAALTSLSMLAFARILQERQITRRWGLLYILATAASLYTHHYALFVIAAQLLFFLLRWRQYRSLGARGLALLAGVGLLYTPWIALGWGIVVGRVSGGESFTFRPLTPWELTRQVLMAFSVGLTMADALPAVLITLVASLLAVSGLWDRRRAESGLLLALWLGMALAGAYIVNLRTPWVHPRYLMLAYPAFAILAGRGLAMLAGRRPTRSPALAAALVIALGSTASLWNLYYDPAYVKGQYRELVATMRELVRPDDAVVTNIPWQEGLLWYYGVLPANGPELLYLPQEYVRRDQAEHARLLADLTSRHRRVWLVLYGLADGHPDSLVERWLDTQAYPAFNLWFQDSRLLLYSLPAPGQYVSGEAPQGSLSADLGVLRLTGVVTSPLSVAAGDVLHVTLGWQALGAPPADYVVALHLLDGAGRRVSQRDAEPLTPTSQWTAGQTVADHHGVLVPVGAPPGDYHLTLSLYARDDGARLGEPVSLGGVRVARPAAFPAPANVRVQHRTGALWGGVQLIGYDVDREAFRAGETAHLTLLWHAVQAPGRDLHVTLQLRGAGGVVAQCDAPLTPGYPTSQWTTGEIVRAHHDLPIGGRAAPGRYDLVAFVEGREAVLGSLEVQSRPINTTAPPIQHPLNARFGQSIELLGYTSKSQNPSPKAQSTNLPAYQLALIWRCTGPVETSYAVFVHLLDANGRIVAQHDAPVPGGGVPTAGWQPGEVVVDEHPVAVPADLPPGDYRLIAGLYDPVTWARLPVLDDAGQPVGDHVLLTTVEVAP